MFAAMMTLGSATPSPPDLTPYIIKSGDQCLAGGSFGDVYKCRCKFDSGEKEVAVKAFRIKLTMTDGDGDGRAARMIRRELGIWQRLQHKNIVPFLGITYGFGIGGSMSLVSLWMPNKTLREFLAERDSTLNLEHRLQLLLDIANGLHYLHSFPTCPVVHGDLNCNNILLDANNTACLADFGYASLVGDIPEALAYLEISTMRPGAMRWAAPEQVLSGETSCRTAKSDIYSFGCISLQESIFRSMTGLVFMVLQVLSGKRPWSEVEKDTHILLLLAQGQKPRRPGSRAILDAHWEFIQQCWTPLQERLSAECIIISIDAFLSDARLEPLCDPLTSPLAQSELVISHDSRLLSNGGSRSDSGPLATVGRSVTSTSVMFKPTRFRLDPDDFVILVMGPTGSGKTNNNQFINTLTGNAEWNKASHLKFDTQNVTLHLVGVWGLRIVLADTPGFDDTYRSDSETLRVIADCIIQKYPDETLLKIAGIIYLHRITDNRMSGSAYRNLQMFGRLCGSVALPRTRLVTTMWDKVKDQAAAERREAQLRDEFWRPLIAGRASMHRFLNSTQSAQAIVGSLLKMGNDGEELLLQEELVKQQKHLNETEAGKMIYNRLQRLLADQKKMVKDLAEEAKQQNNPELVRSLQEECDKIDAQLQKTFEEIKEMKVPLSRRILLWMLGRNMYP